LLLLVLPCFEWKVIHVANYLPRKRLEPSSKRGTMATKWELHTPCRLDANRVRVSEGRSDHYYVDESSVRLKLWEKEQ
jgi:hypothetical protein